MKLNVIIHSDDRVSNKMMDPKEFQTKNVFSVFFSKSGENFPQEFLMGKNFPQPSFGRSKRESCLCYVNPSKKISNQTKIDTKAFKNRPSGPAGLK